MIASEPNPMSSMQVSSWMSSPAHTATPAMPAAEAVALLRRHGIRHLPVTDDASVVGVVTDRDLRGVAAEVPVSAIMSRPAVLVTPRTRIDRAARLLFDRRIGCLPVVEDGRLIGILTQTDAVAALVDVVRLQVGGPHAEVVVAYRPDAMALADQALRALGPESARLVAATREPFGPGLPPERVRLEIESREVRRVLQALRAAGLSIVKAASEEG